MTARIEDSRQWGLHATVQFLAADIATNVVVYLPPGALLLGGDAVVTTVFNGTTPKLTATDNSGSPISFFGNVDAATAAHTGIAAGAGTYYPQGATVTIAVSGGATSGAALVDLRYVVVGRSNEAYGN